MAKAKKKINRNQLRREFKTINKRLLSLNYSINYLINLILQEKLEEGEASGEIPKTLQKRIKEPKTTYFG